MSRGDRAKRLFQVGLLSAAALAGIAVVASGSAFALTSPTTADAGGAVVHALTEPKSGHDALPAEMSFDTPLDLDTVRLLAEHEGVRYWTSLDDQGDMCLIARFGVTDWVAGLSCAPAATVAQRGTGLRLYGPEGTIEAYLVPDGVSTGVALVQRVAANVYVADPGLTKEERSMSAVARSGAALDFSLELFDQPFSLEAPVDGDHD